MLVGDSSGAIHTYDLVTKKPVSRVSVSADNAVSFLKAPAGRGLVAVGVASGRLLLADPRKALQVGVVCLKALQECVYV